MRPTEEARRLEAMFEAAIDGIITIDSNGIVESFNSAATRLFGYNSEEVIGKNIKILMPSPYQEEHDGYLNRYHTTRVPHIIGIGREVKGLHKNGAIFPMRLAVSEVQLDEKLIFTGIIHDLTEVKTAEQKIIRLNEELESKVVARTVELSDAITQLQKTNQVLAIEIGERTKIEKALRQSELELRATLDKEKELGELKSRFVSMASHEFRTPLSTILSSISLIGRYTESSQQDKRDKHIQRIKSSVTHLTNILNDVLSLSKLEEGKIDYQESSFNLNDLCVEIMAEMEGILKKGQFFSYHKEALDISVKLDKKLLRKILFNILSNAIKYSPEEKPIHCHYQVSNQVLQIMIRDEGIGIPKKEQEHLFDRFFRASNVTNIQGTGLGLNIVKNYLELMGGSISYISAENEGTTFNIMIPLNPKRHEKIAGHRR